MPKAINPPQADNPPVLTPGRRRFRRFVRAALRLLVWLFIDLQVNSPENLPPYKPAVVVANHLGDADVVVGVAYSPYEVEIMAKAALYRFPILGWLMQAYGVIWVHPGQPDRRALRLALQVLESGRMLAIAPEGRESLSGALEAGTQGAAYLAHKAGVPVAPIAFTGTENRRIYANMKRLRRTRVTLTIGKMLELAHSGDRQADLQNGTRQIMLAVARLLPPEYRGVYQNELEHLDGSRQPGK